MLLAVDERERARVVRQLAAQIQERGYPAEQARAAAELLVLRAAAPPGKPAKARS